MKDHFLEHLGEESGREILKQVDQEIRSPFYYFDATYCISGGNNRRWSKMIKRFQAMGIEAGVRHFRMVESDESAHLDTTMSHRAIVQEAMQIGLENVLVIGDETLFLNDTLEYLSQSIDELKQREWNLFFLGGQLQNTVSPGAAGCSNLTIPQQLQDIHAVAYNKGVFEKIASDLPDSREIMATWLSKQRGYENYLMQLDNKFIAAPPVTSTTSLLEHEDEGYRSRFTSGEKID